MNTVVKRYSMVLKNLLPIPGIGGPVLLLKLKTRKGGFLINRNLADLVTLD